MYPAPFEYTVARSFEDAVALLMEHGPDARLLAGGQSLLCTSASWCDDTRTVVGFATRREAEATRAKLVHEVNSGTYFEPRATTLSEWILNAWLPTTKTRVKPSTFDSYRRNLELHVLPQHGGQQLRQLTPAMLNSLYAGLLAGGNKVRNGGLSPKTVRYIHTILHKALTDAVDAGIVAVNVAERAKPPRPRATAASEALCWEPQELRRFLDLIRGHRLEAAWHLSAMTGMRRGEVIGL